MVLRPHSVPYTQSQLQSAAEPEFRKESVSQFPHPLLPTLSPPIPGTSTTPTMAQKPKVDPYVGRLGYLQALVSEFQETESQDAKEQVLANLANFAYDPSNYQYLRQLQVLDLFLDSLSEENETLVEFAIGGLCNLCADKANKEYILRAGGIPLIINCLSSPSEETVLSAVTTLMYLSPSGPGSHPELTALPVVQCMLRFSLSANTRLRNLAQIFLEDICSPSQVAEARSWGAHSALGIPLPKD
nr:armadillo repeat-containing protein 7 isoform X1 [Loxodonta africana]